MFHLLLKLDMSQVDVLEAEKCGKGFTLVNVGDVARKEEDENTSGKKYEKLDRFADEIIMKLFLVDRILYI